MLNAVLAALHLLNIRKEFFCFCLFVFLSNMRICVVIWKILFFVSRGSVKVAPQKIHLMLPQRSATGWTPTP